MQWNLYLVHQLIEKYNNVQSVVLVSFQQMQHIIRIYKHYQIIKIINQGFEFHEFLFKEQIKEDKATLVQNYSTGPEETVSAAKVTKLRKKSDDS